MRYLLGLILILIITTSGFAGSGVILHPNLSYKSDNAEAKQEGIHTLGDTVEVIGDEKIVDGNPYRSFKISGDETSHMSSAFFVIDNSVQGVISKSAYIYNYNDLSSITSNKLSPITFLAAINYDSASILTKVNYLVWHTKGYWFVKDGWVKTSNISLKKDDWASAIKYFLASQEKDKELQDKTLRTIGKINKTSIFIPLINQMIETGDLTLHQDIMLDPLFGGTNSELLESYDVSIYGDADLKSEVLFSGRANLQLNSKSLEKVTVNGVTDFLYNVTAGSVTGWTLGLK